MNNNITDVSPSSDELLCRYYTAWSTWSRCNRRCEQHRIRRCIVPNKCGTSFLKEKRKCQRKRGLCSTLSYKVIGNRRNRHIEELLYDLLYDEWSQWGRCTRSCKKRRYRKCREPKICGGSFIQEEKVCRTPGSNCEKRYTLTSYGRSSKIKNNKKSRRRGKGKGGVTSGPLGQLNPQSAIFGHTAIPEQN